MQIIGKSERGAILFRAKRIGQGRHTVTVNADVARTVDHRAGGGQHAERITGRYAAALNG
ncbi:MAG: hypothetical protein ACKOQ4_05705 [Mycobacterium sp.]